MTPAQQAQLKAQLKATIGDKTDLENKLSYDSKIKNVFGMRDTKDTVRAKITNTTANDQIIYFGTVRGLAAMKSLYNLPAGIVFTGSGIQEFGNSASVAAPAGLTVATLNREQNLDLIAQEAEQNPVFFREISMKSYSVDGTVRLPEDSNYGNEIIHYSLTSIGAELKKSTPLRLGQKESRKDVNTSVMSVDTIKERFASIMSKNDCFAIQVNAGTQLEVTLKVGARYSESEFFYRQILGTFDVLSNGVAEDCGCEK